MIRTIRAVVSCGGNLSLYAKLASTLILLAGCSSAPTIPDPPREVRVPVPVPCLRPEDVPQRPSMLSDAQLDALDDKRAVIALGQDRRVRQGYEASMEAAIAGCR
jgi:hypothetical protein